MDVQHARGQSSPVSQASENLNPYDIAQEQYDAAAAFVDMPEGLRTFMRGCSR